LLYTRWVWWAKKKFLFSFLAICGDL
jgi:hypothetical protein